MLLGICYKKPENNQTAKKGYSGGGQLPLSVCKSPSDYYFNLLAVLAVLYAVTTEAAAFTFDAVAVSCCKRLISS